MPKREEEPRLPVKPDRRAPTPPPTQPKPGKGWPKERPPAPPRPRP